ncbi:LytR/AlgR family response regulator transcription factor [Dyadobacter sandarakinus]|uniref:Response regulator transcription factor n=1 Tax=Dyadobacter sandarakinus TaxID=2747268 RepID=A0ABX7IAA0_9BACT|nr:LytTR family DNA-binding domain-containing protein [Dyadobacter sandarakinus]QRR02864.1 response regulator transcription factor [Dyadobacter sandarakinus]
MTCVAIDDEPLALDLLRTYLAAFPDIALLRTFDDAVEAAAFLKIHPVDLLFADINMPDLSGLELVAGLDFKPVVIFTTAHKKYAHEGFELEALDYLLKPISRERFEKAVTRALEIYSLRKTPVPAPEYIVVKSEYKSVRISLADIAFIEGMEDYIKIHLTSEPHPVLTLMSLKSILEVLPAGDFSRIHRSYIIPDRLVKSIQSRKVLLTSGRELPVSGSYLDFIEKWKGK